MKKIQTILVALVSFALLTCGAQAQFVPGQVLSAQQLNSALANVAAKSLPITGGTLTGPISGASATFSTANLSAATIGTASISSLSAATPIPIGSGGTGAATALAATSNMQFRSAAAGAVVRSLASKLADVVDVRDFGAVCNGSAANTAADTAGITAAINSVAAGGAVNFPAGTCYVTPMAFTGLNNVQLVGKGRQATLIMLTSAGIAFRFSNAQWLSISHMAFTTTGAPQSMTGASAIQLDTGSNNALIDDITVYAFGGDGLVCAGTSTNQMSGSKLTNSYFLGNAIANLRWTYCNDFFIANNNFGMLDTIPHPAIGAILSTSNAGTYTGNYHWQNVVDFQQVNSSFNRVIANRFELADQQGVYVTGGSNLTFESNDVHTNSQAGNGQYDSAYFTGVTDSIILGNKIFSWDSSFARWGLNIDGSSSNISLGKNKVFAPAFSTSYGPFSVSAASTNISGDIDLLGSTTSNVASGSTVYLGTNGAQAVETATNYVVPRRAMVMGFYTATLAAPGASQSFTYTLRKNGVSTSMVATSSGASSFLATAANTQPAILVQPGDVIDLQLVTSASATATNHRWYVTLLEY
ncbi:right-handed parallel beta-helix repeat-containing protein [Burkholderia gladioli]|uniref:right-handed parallel beta-helix repeat-containing protein n=1 Tax=Burkholderia gladioli TaxID=28095 RepID=UPI00163E4134|nr:right-handed parallel beta-helix repeat-containing protein [Burkholderia gladioli]